MYAFRQKALPILERAFDENHDEPIHCAKLVLEGIKKQTGIGDDLLENLSFIFDGGIGLQGGACGALAGAIMGINLVMGMSVFLFMNFRIRGREDDQNPYKKKSSSRQG